MNTKMERVIRDIDKTKEKIVEQQAKLRDLEKQKIRLENEEIVALFRREKLSEDEFAALLRTQRGSEQIPNTEGNCDDEE